MSEWKIGSVLFLAVIDRLAKASGVSSGRLDDILANRESPTFDEIAAITDAIDYHIQISVTEGARRTCEKCDDKEDVDHD